MSRLEWILGIVLLVLLVVVIGLALSLWLGPETNIASPLSGPEAAAAGYADDIAPTRSTPQQTAKNAYVSAQKAAQGWQEDAVLVSATATWPQGVKASDLVSGQETWGLFFIHHPKGQRPLFLCIKTRPAYRHGTRHGKCNYSTSPAGSKTAQKSCKRFSTMAGMDLLKEKASQCIP
ncbi:MAG: hypothetical protein IPH82_16165 [Chloroflexi bacterium]|nr:hypothetical protein [Chloroflexota bacterium]